VHLPVEFVFLGWTTGGRNHKVKVKTNAAEILTFRMWSWPACGGERETPYTRKGGQGRYVAREGIRSSGWKGGNHRKADEEWRNRDVLENRERVLGFHLCKAEGVQGLVEAINLPNKGGWDLVESGVRRQTAGTESYGETSPAKDGGTAGRENGNGGRIPKNKDKAVA